MPEKRGGARTVTRRMLWTVISALVVVAVLVTVLVSVLIARDDAGSGPRALTPDEVNRLAIARFRDYEATGRAVTITVPNPDGRLTVTGVVDYRKKFGYGVVRGEGRNSSGSGLIEWSATTVFVRPSADVPAQPPVPAPVDGWFRRPLQNAGSALDSALAIVLGLGADRPDNAQLLSQNGAAWVGRDRVGGVDVDIMSGPGSRDRAGTAGTVRYWLGPDGTPYRVEATVASEQEPVVVDLGAPGPAPVTPLPGLVPSQ